MLLSKVMITHSSRLLQSCAASRISAIGQGCVARVSTHYCCHDKSHLNPSNLSIKHSINGHAYLHTSSKTSMQILSKNTSPGARPAVAIALGMVGILPFSVPFDLMLMDGHFIPEMALYQNCYAATILSFLGGIRWGVALERTALKPSSRDLLVSVVPQLWGWGALVASHAMDCLVVGNVGVSAGLVLIGIADVWDQRNPVWFRMLRFVLTAGAVASMMAVLFCLRTMEEKSIKVYGNEWYWKISRDKIGGKNNEESQASEGACDEEKKPPVEE